MRLLWKILTPFLIVLATIQSGIVRISRSMMPKQAYTPPEIEVKWEDFKKEVRPWHFILALVSVSSVLALVLWGSQFPLLRLSVVRVLVSGVDVIIDAIAGKDVDTLRYAMPIFFYLYMEMLIRAPKMELELGRVKEEDSIITALPRYAMREEREFRAGSENWSLVNKLRACLIFGFIHLSMLIIPISIALAISVSGALFMAIYLSALKRGGTVEKALMQSTIVHAAHNLLAFAVIGMYVVFVILELVVGWVV